MYYRILLCVLLCLTSVFFVRAQQDSVNLSYYFDDGGISTFNWMIKTDIVSIIHGDAPIIVEKMLHRDLTLEGGIGLILPYYVHDFLAIAFTENRGIENNYFGHSLRLHLKWYSKAPERDYWGIHYYRRAFNDISVNEWYFTRGDQRVLGKRLLLDIALGLGFRSQQVKGKQYMFDPDFAIMPVMPLIVRFGFIR